MKKQCTLIISHSCNLNCTYCYEHFKSNRKMSFETAKHIITKEIQQLELSEYEGIEFLLIGGEPLTNYRLIEKICTWAQNIENIHFRLITNGTLFNSVRKEWFEANKELITVDISIDGIDNMQQTNRGCETHELPIAWIHSIWPENRFKMTISPQTLPDLAKGIIHLENQGYPTIPTLAIGVDWSINDAIIYKQQLEQLSQYYLTNTNKRIPSLLLRSIDSIFIKEMEIYKSCETGDTAITYDTNGDTYPCIIFSPLVLKQNEDWRNIDFTDKNIFEDEDCKGCIIKNMCKTCYGFNYKYRGHIHSRDKRLCPMYKTEIKAICFFQKRFIENRAKQHIMTDKEKDRYNKVCIICRELNDF